MTSDSQGGREGGGQGARESSLTASLSKLPALSSANTAQGGESPDARTTRKPPKTQEKGTSVGRPSLSKRASHEAATASQRVADQPRRLVSLAAAAAYADVSTRTLRRYISQGRLTGYRVGPRLVKVDLNELEKLARPIPTAGS